MIKAYQKTISALFILLLILFVSSPVQAGDEARDKAIAIGVGLLATGIEMLSQPSEQQDNTEATKVTQKPKTQIQYSKEVANIQSNLKDLGFYHGSIDGLKGQQTYQAIEAWRQSVDSEDTGELNIYEIDVLNDRAKTARENKKYEKTPLLSIAQANETPLEQAYVSYFGNKALFQVCHEFQNSNHELSHTVDNTLEVNYSKVNERTLKEIEKIQECFDINADAVPKIKERGRQKYKQSRLGQTMDIALKTGPHVFISEQDVYSRIEGCNAYSRKMKLMHKNLKNKPITCDTVQ